MQSQVCQRSAAKGSEGNHAEDAEDSSASSAAFTFSTNVSICLEEPETPRLFLPAAKSQPRVLGSGVLIWDALTFGSKVSQYVLHSCS